MIICDFCNKSTQEIELMIAGPKEIHICNECIDVCVEVIKDTREKGQEV